MSNHPDATETQSTPTRPWWRKKRWVFAGILWVGFTYLLSTGPANYAEGRGWLTSSTVRTYCRPAWSLTWEYGPLGKTYSNYTNWWRQRGRDMFVHRLDDFRLNLSVAWTDPGDGNDGAQIFKNWTSPNGTTFSRYTLQLTDGHEIVVGNCRELPDGSWKWDGPVLFDGKTAAVLPAGTRKVSIEYIDGELAVEADGVEIDVEQ